MIDVLSERKLWMIVHKGITREATALRKRLSSTKSPRVFENVTKKIIDLCFYIQSEDYRMVCEFALRNYHKEKQKIMNIIRG